MATDLHESAVERASRGDAAAIDTLLERHYPALLAYVRLHAEAVIRQHESCADIVQSVCREVLEDEELGRFAYQGEPAFRKWLFKKAMYKLVDRKKYYLAQRRDPHRVQPISQIDSRTGCEGVYASLCSPSGTAIAAEDIERFERAFALLSEDYKHVITLSRLVGMSHRDIASEMGRTEGAVRVLLHRALARLGILMQEARAD
jgi:RNA polymerase sigma-70 factor (ECF subfamily)